MAYKFFDVEKKWQAYWADNKTFKSKINPDKPKYYVLDMFPYPSGAGLHVGHPLGYIASDIFSRYKRLQGFEVLHPMGYDSFGLPAEQYAIQTGQHPDITTKENIARYRQQLDRIGFSFDWDREVRTSEKDYYRWTQEIFISLFNSWYNNEANKAESVDTLIEKFESSGTENVNAACSEELEFSADDWKNMTEDQQYEKLLNCRMAYLSETVVNWCPELGTVLANDEVKNGVSERGGYPVEQKKMKQWSLRITAYADRLLNDLDTIDWPDSIKEIQRNWIGKSQGATVHFEVKDSEEKIEVFTTRPDTIFGVSFMVVAPEHEIVSKITSSEQREEVEAYIEQTSKRSERDRMSDVKHISGAFTGAYVKHPFTGEDIPIWIGDYVLAHYGTGAIMAVPSGDQRDWNFANHFNLPIPNIIEGGDLSNGAIENKQAILANSDFLNGLKAKKAIGQAIYEMEKRNIGTRKINFKLRDAGFSRQRYWGEPIPAYFKNGMPYMMDSSDLPLELPAVDKYLPTKDGEPPLARAEDWVSKDGFPLETNTMPGWAGSSWYYLRYMDPQNDSELFSKEAVEYWNQVDLYLGGAEHATGHLLYVRFWAKFLNDLGTIPFNEPAKKLINQGMIQGVSAFVYRKEGTKTFISKGLIEGENVTPIHVNIDLVKDNILNVEGFKKWREEYANAEFILEDGKYICGSEVEKMSKSKYNVVNPDGLIEQYGADALRLHEMFLGPIEMHKPWNTKGIDGVSRFLRKFWALYHDENDQLNLNDAEPTKEELKILHKTIKSIQDDMERFSFNTIVSHLMICVNDLSSIKCNNRSILSDLAVLAACHAPHITEELWQRLGNTGSISFAKFPKFNPEVLVESDHNYPVSFNGKMRFKISLPLDIDSKEVENIILNHEDSQKWLNGQKPKKIIYVKKKIINIVL
ncbi:leucine--tRNA ligase [bacterium SCSIO 12643]|nr:leucine--tRNA ligase [bacterium SCSIO 12643]